MRGPTASSYRPEDASEAELRRAEDRLRRVEDEVRGMEERCQRAEERARKADDRVRQGEEQQEIRRQAAEANMRRQQEEATSLREVCQHQDSSRRETERLKHEHEFMRHEVDRISGEAEQARRRLQEEAELMRRGQQQQEADRLAIQRLQEEVRLEREARASELRQEAQVRRRALEQERAERGTIEARSVATSSAIAQATRAAQEALQAVHELKEKSEVDVSNVRRVMEAIQIDATARVEELEVQMKTCYSDALKRMSMPNRIMCYKTMQHQAGSKPVEDKAGNHRTLDLKFTQRKLTGDIVGDKPLSPAFKPLFRRMP